jgi:hypothetical protein
VIIQGVKFTFKAIPSSAWEVDIWASADASAQNLVLAINGTGTPWATTYIEVDEDDRARLEWVTATDWTDLITIVSKNWALNAVSSMTAADNDFQAQVSYACIMVKWAIKLGTKWMVRTTTRKNPLNLAINYFIYARYWLKVTTRSKEQIIAIPLVSSAAES